MILYGFWRHVDIEMNRAMNVMKLGSVAVKWIFCYTSIAESLSSNY